MLAILLGASSAHAGGTALSTPRPDFSATLKTVENLSRTEGAAQPGDRLRYIIATTNKNDPVNGDASVGTTLRDPLPAGLVYVSNSLLVNGRPVSDADGDDVGSCDGHTVLIYLGRGATSDTGGQMSLGDSATLSFEAQVAPDAQGSIDNQAFLNAGGEAGAAPEDTPSRPAADQPPGPTTVILAGLPPSPDAGTPEPETDAGTPGPGADAGTPGPGADAGTPSEPDSQVPSEDPVPRRGCSASGGASLVWWVTLLGLVPLMRSRLPGRLRRSASVGGVDDGSSPPPSLH